MPRVLANLSNDIQLVEYLTELMDLSKRLDLIKYLGDARGLPSALKAEIKDVRRRAKKLSEFRNELAHNAIVVAGAAIAQMDTNTSNIVVGVRLPKSKRAYPSTPLDTIPKMLAAIEKWHHTARTIREETEKVIEIQSLCNALAKGILIYRYPANNGA